MEDYHFYEEIGRGDHSVVFKARRKKTIEYVAVKSVDRSEMERVGNEVYIMHKLAHPNTLKFYSWYATRNHVWLILEYVSGGDLRALLDQDKRLPESVIKVFGVDILSGLQYIHANGILYCDLKPANLLVNEYGVLKLCDFGLARKVPQKKSDVKPDADRGTPSYMAPELFEAEGVHSFASDLWSFGCVLYELYIGHPPFQADELPDLLRKVNGDPVPLPARDSELAMSPEFEDILTGLLRKDPDERMTWHELLKHPFWSMAPTPRGAALPPQPLFDVMVEARRHRLAERGVVAAPSPLHTADDHNSVEGDIDALSDESDGAKSDDDVEPQDPVDSGDEEHDGASSRSKRSHWASSGAGSGAGAGAGSRSRSRSPSPDHPYDEGRPKGRGEGKRRDRSPRAATAEPGSTRGDRRGRDPAGSADVAGEKPATAPGVYTAEANGRGRSGAADHDEFKSGGNARRQGWQHADVDIHDEDDYWASLLSVLPDGGEKAVSIDQILLHASDIVVTSIVGNRSIEPPVVPTVKTRGLSFSPLPAPKVARLGQAALESHLTNVIRALAPGTTTSDRLAVLAYCFTLAQVADIANFIVNSSLMARWVRLLEQRKCPTSVRGRVALVMGVAVRHATYISASVQGEKVLEVLRDCTQSKNQTVRRRSMGVLGELLFYIAAQDEPEVGRERRMWIMPGWAVPLLSKSLESSDRVLRHYAAKTLENIMAQSPAFGSKFATQSVGGHLLDFALHSRSSALRSTAAAALTHLLRRAPNLRGLVLEREGRGVRFISTGIKSNAPDMQLAAINILNLVMWSAESPPSSRHGRRGRRGHGEEVSAPLRSLRRQVCRTAARSLLPYLVRIVDGAPTTPVSGKAMLSLALLIRHDGVASPHGRPFLVACAERRLPAVLDRVVGKRAELQRNPYTAQCLRLLVDYMVQAAGGVMQGAAASVAPRSAGPSHDHATPEVHAVAVPVVLALLASTLFQNQLVTRDFVERLAMCLAGDDASSGRLESHPEMRRIILLVVEAMTQLPRLLAQQQEGVILRILPQLVAGLRHRSGDQRALYTKLLVDTLEALLEEARENAPDLPKLDTAALQAFVVTEFVPRCKALLADRDPIPQYTIRGLLCLTEWSPPFVSVLLRFGLVDVVLARLAPERPRRTGESLPLSGAVVALVQRIVESGEVKWAALVGSGLVPRTITALQQSVREHKWECCVRLLDLVYGTLYELRAERDTPESASPRRDPADSFTEWLRLVSTMCSLLLMDTRETASRVSLSRFPPSGAVHPAAARCLLLLAEVFGERFCKSVLGGRYSPLRDVTAWMVSSAKRRKPLRDDETVQAILLKTLLLATNHVPDVAQELCKEPEFVALVRKVATASTAGSGKSSARGRSRAKTADIAHALVRRLDRAKASA